jgi:hypothetical protein
MKQQVMGEYGPSQCFAFNSSMKQWFSIGQAVSPYDER